MYIHVYMCFFTSCTSDPVSERITNWIEFPLVLSTTIKTIRINSLLFKLVFSLIRLKQFFLMLELQDELWLDEILKIGGGGGVSALTSTKVFYFSTYIFLWGYLVNNMVCLHEVDSMVFSLKSLLLHRHGECLHNFRFIFSDFLRFLSSLVELLDVFPPDTPSPW